ncbi:transcriptional regulator, PadR family [Clostridium acidisoli DSM 12555]|uniref:Transcriptional regulator, PadR family n=1 Tax=Clostridium acidisoli DSM 12555 TaxID=1121291 RepID=A0A1W1XDI8_9CLOT|nr:PadR family transcriptional regulator [Clostridium acidisoli]SMC22105.1 transcriptional regulator, PadR family [Clostridium acidisoli DSM 12555]
MVRALILYFLSIKPTHGYDIQRFIEINGMDQWARIQSGSIYYALNKLEKQGFIYTLREERNGARIRKIYAINDNGKEELRRTLKEELLKPIDGVESDKFMIYLMFNRLTKDEIISGVREHIKSLEEKKKWWEKGRELKVLDTTLKSEVLHFDVVINTLDYHVKWHEMLIKEVDDLFKFSDGVENLIGKIDFGNLDEVKYKLEGCKNFTEIQQITDDIVKDPNNLEEKLAKLINLLREN